MLEIPLKDEWGNKNLFRETLEALSNNGKTLADVLWVGTTGKGIWGQIEGKFCTPLEFWEYAKGVWYHAGIGHREVATDLVVVGEDFWLERREYDGAEWWEFKSMPTPARRGRAVEFVMDSENPDYEEGE